MRDLGKIIAHIPARAGSKRLKIKNLRYLSGEPLLAYTVKAALQVKNISDVYVNTESDIIANLGEELGAKIYKRSVYLASDAATSDEFNIDIINTLKPDTLIMINAVCPLIEPSDIDEIIEVYKKDDVDALITTTSTAMQCFYQGKAINIDINSQLAPTQKNDSVHICNWAITIWDAKIYKNNFEKRGYAVFGNNLKLYPIHPLKAIKISTEEDFDFAEKLLSVRKIQGMDKKDIKYWGEK